MPFLAEMRAMLIHKIARTLRKEGVRGLWSRLRYPRLPGNRATFRQLSPPVNVIGEDTSKVAAVAGVVQRFLEWPIPPAGASGAAATVPAGRPGTTLHLDPRPDAPPPGPTDVFLFEDAARALDCLQRFGAGQLEQAGGIILPTAEVFLACRRSGLPGGRLFLSGSSTPDGALELGLLRWMVSTGLCPAEVFAARLQETCPPFRSGDRVCLGLPESPDRRAGFLAAGLGDFRLVDGVRIDPGWQGSAWSHAAIARAALAQGATPLLVCEDDMRPGPDFAGRLARVERYLAGTEWDVFSGLLSDLSETCTISRVVEDGDLTFVHLDFTTGMVMNIYGQRALERIAAWLPEAGGPETNTIDAWLGRLPGLRVVTTLPFLARHDGEAVSTAFGFANRRYDSLIAGSERRLAEMVHRWRGT
jgi:hypothetical protein